MQAADDGYAGLGKSSDDKQNATNRRRLKKLSDTVRNLRSCADRRVEHGMHDDGGNRRILGCISAVAVIL